MIRTLFLVVGALAVIASTARAQSGTAEIWGHVSAASGDAVDHADVTVTSVDTGASRHTHTNAAGDFALTAIPAGHYQVTATHDGFAGRRQEDIVLVPGQRLQLDLPLRQAALPETIALNPYPPIAESARTHTASVIGQEEIDTLPVAGRRYLRLGELAPAVTQDAVTGGVSVMGLPSAQNRVVIDGFDHTSSLTGEPMGGDGPLRSPYQVSLAGIDAFRVDTNAAPAEIGRAGGGVFNLATQSGANAFHGSAYEFFGDRALNGERAVDESAGLATPPYRSNQFGATVGGPISRRHDFFFLNYDGIDRPDQNQHLGLVRTDHDYGGQHVMLRYMDQRFDADAASLSAPALLRNRSGAATIGSAFGSVFVNEARGQYAENRDDNANASSVFGSHRFDTTRVQAGDTVSLVLGPHAVKVGGDAIRDRDSARFDLLEPTRVDVDQFAAFIQDAWRASPALTVDLGVRYDLQDFGGTIRTDRNNWAPRIGFAFAPGARQNVFRAAYGLFYASTPALIPALANAVPAVMVDPAFSTARVHQASAGWETEKYRVGTVGIDYLFARGERLPRAVDVGQGLVSFQSTGASTYNGVTFHIRARLLNEVFFRSAYTYARADETPSEPIAVVFGTAGDRRALAVQGSVLNVRAPANNDQRHHLTVATVWDSTLATVNRRGVAKTLLKDWQVALVYSWQTGNPYTAFVNGDINGDENTFNDVAPGTARNQYRLPFQSSFDPRVTRRIGLGGTREVSLIWEAFNLTNRANYTAADNTLYFWNGSTLVQNPAFGRRIAQLDGRVMQLAARIRF